MAQRVSGIDDGVFEDADEEAGKRSDHLDTLAFERVADDADDVAFVHEFAAGAVPMSTNPPSSARIHVRSSSVSTTVRHQGQRTSSCS